jgi:hypothetical protein
MISHQNGQAQTKGVLINLLQTQEMVIFPNVIQTINKEIYLHNEILIATNHNDNYLHPKTISVPL